MGSISLSLGRNGLQDWLLQRISAIILAAYFIFLFVYFYLHPDITFTEWQDLFSSIWFRFFTFFTLLSLVVHAWIGLWIVISDYLQKPWLRLPLQLLVNILLIGYLVWGIVILSAI